MTTDLMTIREFVEWATKDLEHFRKLVEADLAARPQDLDADGVFRAALGVFWCWWQETTPHDEVEILSNERHLFLCPDPDDGDSA